VNGVPRPRIELSTLSLGSSLGKGGQGQVTAVTNILLNKQWPAVLKEYSPEAKRALQVTALESIAEFPETLAHQESRWLHDSTAWPVAVVQDQGVACGFLMRAVPPAYYFDFRTQTRGTQRKLADMAFLLNPEAFMRGAGIAITDHDRLMLLESVAAALSRLHALQITVGDLSPKNLLFSLTPAPSCFLIDCDAVRLRGLTVLDQVETPDWEAPPGEPRATAATDAFKFGLLAIRLFARDQSSRDATALAAVSPELGRFARLSQRDSRQRPAPGAWMTALSAAALSISATAASRPAAPRPVPTAPRISVPIPTLYPTTNRPAVHPTTNRPAVYPTTKYRPPSPAPAVRPPRRARRRPAGPLLMVACVIAIAAVVGVFVHNAMKTSATAAGIGDSCLVGTWRDGAGNTSTKWNGEVVAMHGGAGNVDHISAKGTDEDTWGGKAKPLYGTYKGHRLKEIIHGHNTLTIYATKTGHKITSTEDGWSTGSTNEFTYKGRTYSGYLSQHGTTSVTYECTAHKLTWRYNGHTLDRETRISATP